MSVGIGLLGAGAFIAFAGLIVGLAIWRPNLITQVRINLLWLTTLVAILTLVFGMELIGLLSGTPSKGTSANTSTNTIEIVLSSLVGVGIGGLIAIAGQLVQDASGGDTSEQDNQP